MGPLLAALMKWIVTKAGPTTIGVGIGDLVNIDILRQQAVKLAPTSDPEALEEAARQLMRMLGLDGSDVLFPPGGPANWNYFHMDMRTGRSWWTRRYISRAGQKALIRAVTRAPAAVVGGAARNVWSGYRGRRPG